MTARPKSCGPCGLCCKVFAVEELAKPMGVMCAHRSKAVGCSIHPDRPASCRSFECVWLMDPEMPHRFRPDQTQVVLDQDADGQRLIARCDRNHATAGSDFIRAQSNQPLVQREVRNLPAVMDKMSQKLGHHPKAGQHRTIWG